MNNGIQAILNGLSTSELTDQIKELKEKKAMLESVIASAEIRVQDISVESIEERLRENAINIESQDPEVLKVTIQRHVPSITVNGDGTISFMVGYIFPDKKKGKQKKPVQTTDGTGCTLDGFGSQKPSKIKGSEKQEKTRVVTGTTRVAHSLAGAVGLEPTTNGFGDHYSTN